MKNVRTILGGVLLALSLIACGTGRTDESADTQAPADDVVLAGIIAIPFTRDGASFATVSEAGYATVWNAKTYRARFRISSSTPYSAAAFFGDDLLLGTRNGTLSRTSGKDEHTPYHADALEGGEVVACFTLKTNNDVFAVVGTDDGYALHVWNGDVADAPSRVTPLAGDEMLLSARFHPSGAFFVSRIPGPELLVYDTETGEVLQTLTNHEMGVLASAFSADGAWFASAGYGKKTCMWRVRGKTLSFFRDVDDPMLYDVKKCGSGIVSAIALSSDGGMLATGAQDSRIRVWNARTSIRIATLTGHSTEITSLAFTHDGTHLLSGALSGSVIVWDVRNNRTVRTLSSY